MTAYHPELPRSKTSFKYWHNAILDFIEDKFLGGVSEFKDAEESQSRNSTRWLLNYSLLALEILIVKTSAQILGVPLFATGHLAGALGPRGARCWQCDPLPAALKPARRIKSPATDAQGPGVV